MLPVVQLVLKILTGAASVVGRDLWQRHGDDILRTVNKTVSSTTKKVLPTQRMSVEEAKQVLGIDFSTTTVVTPEIINKRFDHLFLQNDPLRGGSQYLQGKILTAKDTLDDLVKSQNPSNKI